MNQKQTGDYNSYEDTETSAIEEKKKRLRYESIRIEESKKEI